MELKPQETTSTGPELNKNKVEKGMSPHQIALKRFMKNKIAVASVVILLIIVIAVLCAPLITDHNPTKSNLTMIERPPSAEHPLGNDSSGRDNLARLLYGGRISLIVGLVP